jgi:hypothetical protein
MPLLCPSCAAPFEAGALACPVCGRALAASPPAPAGAPPGPGPEPIEKRRDERLSLATDVRICKLGPGGVPEKEERTIAHDLSRSGMRLLTTWSDLVRGDQISIEEVGGSFSSAAVVRHLNRGTDQITRVGIEFIEKKAPERQVGTTTGIARPVFDTSRSYPRLTPPPEITASVPRPATTSSFPRPVTANSIPRPVTASSIPRPGTTSSIPRPVVVPPPPPPSAPSSPPLPPEKIAEQVAEIKTAARALVGEGKVWEALESLARAQALAEGTPEAPALRILTLETQAKVPSLRRTAQQNLEEMARADPDNVAVHSALGRFFWQAGLAARSRIAFQRVLALDPVNREATAALAALNDPAKRR